jgi:hypothetical protein
LRQLPFPPEAAAEIYPAYRKPLTACPLFGHFPPKSLFHKASILIEFATKAVLILVVFEMDLIQVLCVFESTKSLI